MSTPWSLPPPSGAVAAMLAADAEREGVPFRGWAGEWAVPATHEQPPPLPLFTPPPPDWEAERVERERLAALERVTEPSPALHHEDEEHRPAQPRRDGDAA